VSPPSGPFAVGQCDCMWTSVDTAHSSGVGEGGGGDAEKMPAHKLMVRIYYPVDREAASKCPPGAWLPDSHGGGSYAEAYARALFKPGVNSALVGTLGFVPLMSNVTTQTVVDAPVIGMLSLACCSRSQIRIACESASNPLACESASNPSARPSIRMHSPPVACVCDDR
jgi:hypothetical protein